MSSYRSKGFWIAFIVLLPLLLIIAYHELKAVTSVYKHDLGNGVVIYADDHVKTGQWVFYCKYRRLISRKPLSAPLLELKNAGELPFTNMFNLNKSDEQSAREALKAITKTHDWYKNLRYLYSALDDNSDIRYHTFDLLIDHSGRAWAIILDQLIDHPGKSSFAITAIPYNQETYVNYRTALLDAANSCPILQ
ncbi:hypothetical protein IB260_07995 [Pseudomonas sp. PDM23]|uniref:hypothetical protein n=1 Tax=unclassified Pseudomonas TaxID=196821 RepID=UPI001780BE0B|nr:MULTISPECIES: hypothetical protein [unclassified Pseudomonas]MBD9575244.1 hypothetical protein [Pseudomonas sp. PDM23]MBD9669814.1 hypothetical protein [Pseudomonas sp. PDM21]